MRSQNRHSTFCEQKAESFGQKLLHGSLFLGREHPQTLSDLRVEVTSDVFTLDAVLLRRKGGDACGAGVWDCKALAKGLLVM